MPGSLRVLGSRQVWVEDQGDGPAVVFIHGLGGTSNVFDGQVSAIAATNRVITFDLAGHGMSPVPSSTSVEEWAADVLALLDDSGVGSAVLVAHSLGTLIAQQVIATHPERVDAAVLLGPIRDLASAGRQSQQDRAALVRSQGMAAVAYAISRAATSPDTQANQPSVTAFVKELLQRQSPEGYAASCVALGQSIPPDVSTFERSVLLITGSNDGVSPAARIDDIAAVFANATTAVIEGIGHWTPIEATVEVNQLLVAFLSDSFDVEPLSEV
jgi:3-oxoadipate enol-lactonase